MFTSWIYFWYIQRNPSPMDQVTDPCNAVCQLGFLGPAMATIGHLSWIFAALPNVWPKNSISESFKSDAKKRMCRRDDGSWNASVGFCQEISSDIRMVMCATSGEEWPFQKSNLWFCLHLHRSWWKPFRRMGASDWCYLVFYVFSFPAKYYGAAIFKLDRDQQDTQEILQDSRSRSRCIYPCSTWIYLGDAVGTLVWLDAGCLCFYLWAMFQPLLASLFLDVCSGGTCPKSRGTRLRNSWCIYK